MNIRAEERKSLAKRDERTERRRRGYDKKVFRKKDATTLSFFYRTRFANVRILNYATHMSVDSWVRFREDFFDDGYITEMTPEVSKIIKEHAIQNAEDGMIKSQNSATVIWWKAKGDYYENIRREDGNRP